MFNSSKINLNDNISEQADERKLFKSKLNMDSINKTRMSFLAGFGKFMNLNKKEKNSTSINNSVKSKNLYYTNSENSIFAKFRSDVEKSQKNIDENTKKFIEKNHKKISKKIVFKKPEEPKMSNESLVNANTKSVTMMNFFQTALSTEEDQSTNLPEKIKLSSTMKMDTSVKNMIETNFKINTTANQMNFISDKKNPVRKSNNLRSDNTSLQLPTEPKEDNQQTEPAVYSRLKSYKVSYLSNWFEKNKLPAPIYSASMINDMEFQSSSISDEIRVLLDNLLHFKMSYLSDNSLLPAFRNLNIGTQIKINKTIEETCGLMMEIPTIILLDFVQYLNRFVTVRPPSPDRFSSKEVKNEPQNFGFNCRLLNEIGTFLKTCFEVYQILIRQVNDMNLSPKNFNKLIEFLARARYNISSIVMFSKNSINRLQQDKKIVSKFAIDTQEYSNDTNVKKRMTSLLPQLPDNIETKKFIQKIDKPMGDYNKYAIKINEENQRRRRLRFIFENDRKEENSFEQKKSKLRYDTTALKNSVINSDELTKLLKYIPKVIREEILSLRLVNRYTQNDDT